MSEPSEASSAGSVPHQPRWRVTVLTRVVYPLHPPGGMERAVYEQLRHLSAVGLALMVVTQPPAAPSPGDAHADADAEIESSVSRRFVRYGDLPLRRNSIADRLTNYPLFVRRVGRLLRDEPALAGDLVHAHGLLAAAAPPGPPLVYAPHGLEEFSRADWRKWLAYGPIRAALRRAAGRAAAVLATDAAMAPAVRVALRLPADRVRVIPNGVAVASLDRLVNPSLQAGLAQQLGLAEAPLRLVTCARLEANKGLDLGLLALARTRDALPVGWRWWIVGAGREEAALRRQIAVLDMEANVHLLGRLSDVELHSLLPTMDLYLMPSRYEGSSLATLEAMTHRLPVLASRVGGIPDKVLPDRTGYLAPAGDADGLAAALRAALADRARWPALGEAGRALVIDRFAWPAIARQLVGLYGELLGRGASGAGGKRAGG